MNKPLKKAIIAGLVLTAMITGCSSTNDPTTKAPGFLPNYSLLKPITPSPDGTQIYSYKNPDVDKSDYPKGIVEPVTIYEGATSESTVTSEQIENARKGIDDGVKQIATRKLKLTNKPGNGVARINVAITGATLEEDGFKPWNIIPVSAAIKLASMATGLNGKKPILVVEVKITDSVTGELLKETATTISGDNFRMSSNTAEEFQQLAVKWVDEAMKYTRTAN